MSERFETLGGGSAIGGSVISRMAAGDQPRADSVFDDYVNRINHLASRLRMMRETLENRNDRIMGAEPPPPSASGLSAADRAKQPSLPEVSDAMDRLSLVMDGLEYQISRQSILG